AERGAVLLSEDLDAFEQSSALSTANAKSFRALALHNVQEEEAYALLETFSSLDRQPKLPGMTCWAMYRLIPGEVAEEAARSMHADALRRLEHPQSVPLHRMSRVQKVLLVFGWTVGEQDEDCAARIERCHKILPLVGDSIGAVIASILLAERVHELERTAVREALEGMELLKAELLGTVSHELRSPLASIKGYAATLLRHERRLQREERHQFLLAINEASDRLEVIIGRLLEMSQLETDQVTIEPSPVDVAHLAREAIAAIEERVVATFADRFVFGLKLENADGSASQSAPLIMADPRRLREVFDNLLENAIKYSPEGGLIKVIIRPLVHVQDSATGRTLRKGAINRIHQATTHVSRKMLEICVTDTGLGIPIEHLERIFDRFHRVDTRLTREVNGLGLGLAICKHIVELHQGVIWAENRPHGRGSAFYVQLPLGEIPII
ncbi:MAG TPA: ATP-binding protein, partial [Ktedonobacteraceae bacterium]|nr:ATP-binding protein [Ktedonobacteraceae bacterium]